MRSRRQPINGPTQGHIPIHAVVKLPPPVIEYANPPVFRAGDGPDAQPHRGGIYPKNGFRGHEQIANGERSATV